mmetsp:Transcript_6596/g.23561  ORF Transcript_6596/g.23561 Transcript_6596/m.23561 type:complete len:340 (-) Transcript_6596:635-1654(-)
MSRASSFCAQVSTARKGEGRVWSGEAWSWSSGRETLTLKKNSWASSDGGSTRSACHSTTSPKCPTATQGVGTQPSMAKWTWTCSTTFGARQAKLRSVQPPQIQQAAAGSLRRRRGAFEGGDPAAERVPAGAKMDDAASPRRCRDMLSVDCGFESEIESPAHSTLRRELTTEWLPSKCRPTRLSFAESAAASISTCALARLFDATLRCVKVVFWRSTAASSSTAEASLFGPASGPSSLNVRDLRDDSAGLAGDVPGRGSGLESDPSRAGDAGSRAVVPGLDCVVARGVASAVRDRSRPPPMQFHDKSRVIRVASLPRRGSKARRTCSAAGEVMLFQASNR